MILRICEDNCISSFARVSFAPTGVVVMVVKGGSGGRNEGVGDEDTAPVSVGVPDTVDVFI
jgi:hypothetical protein